MNSRYLLALAALALGLAACQGSFGSGGTSAPGGVAPPVNAQMPASSMPNAMGVSPHASTTPTIPPGNTVTYAVSDAAQGVRCPQDQGFSCTVQFAVVTPSPSPSASGSPSPTPSPTPTPTPTATPTGISLFSPTPKPSPTADVPHLTLTIAGMPKDAPKMNDPDPKAVATVALVALRLRTDADVTLAGKALIDFTLPQEQLGGRGFAVQLYHESVSRRKTNDRFIGSYSKSNLQGTTLHFQLTTPTLQIKKDETWLLVLYGDELPSATSSPKPSPSSSSSPKPTPSTSPTASSSAVPSTTPSPTASPTLSP